eukprot:Skav214836  [mRNA]  locus=scaffold1772:311713:315681:+ [translate_table: standard]
MCCAMGLFPLLLAVADNGVPKPRAEARSKVATVSGTVARFAESKNETRSSWVIQSAGIVVMINMRIARPQHRCAEYHTVKGSIQRDGLDHQDTIASSWIAGVMTETVRGESDG